MSEALGKIIAVGVLLVFAATGVRVILNPDWFIRRSGMPTGGEMLKTWNRDSMRVVGVVLVVGAVYMLFELLAD